MPERTEHYEVQYSYYQYNSGQADNGIKHFKRRCGSADEAIELANQITLSSAGELDEETDHELQRDLISYHGYFLQARAYHVVTELEPLSPLVPAPRR